MLGRAKDKYASTASSDKKQFPLHFNAGAANLPPINTGKRKYDRSMSNTSLSSLHQQSWSADENTTPKFIDLTDSPEKRSEIQYPPLGSADAVIYPSLPPMSKRSAAAPASSAPVPWSSSPAEHFEHPNTRSPSKETPSPEPVRPAKKRALPHSFSKPPAPAPRTDYYGKRDRDWKLEREISLKQHQGGVIGGKTSQAMSDMLEKPSFPRQRTTAHISRSSSDRPAESLVKQAEKEISKTERVPEVFLSDEQKAVMKAVMEEGKSVFFTGSAGTGKSVLMKAIIAQLKHKFRTEPDRFAVTASTGLASCILEGQTLHSWSGIGLGKEPAPELIKKIKRNQKAKQRWLRTKLLIIDEVSMVDGQLFDKLDQVARTIKNNGRPFGGIQLVVTGDFFQLPPVPEKNTIAKFVFEGVTWNTCIQHTILLTHVFRQKDEKFASMLNEMRMGKMSPATVKEFKSLSRPLNFHDDLEATEL